MENHKEHPSYHVGGRRSAKAYVTDGERGSLKNGLRSGRCLERTGDDVLVMDNPETKDACECLRKYRRHLTRQQVRTLMGQIKSGNIDGAMNGLSKILTRKGL